MHPCHNKSYNKVPWVKLVQVAGEQEVQEGPVVAHQRPHAPSQLHLHAQPHEGNTQALLNLLLLGLHHHLPHPLGEMVVQQRRQLCQLVRCMSQQGKVICYGGKLRVGVVGEVLVQPRDDLLLKDRILRGRRQLPRFEHVLLVLGERSERKPEVRRNRGFCK